MLGRSCLGCLGTIIAIYLFSVFLGIIIKTFIFMAIGTFIFGFYISLIIILLVIIYKFIFS